ncbi:MAG: hypothetical protein K0S55_1242, partial [Clostridia bacterium]|nr:hypothetical protein [Clostridia bacterium]
MASIMNNTITIKTTSDKHSEFIINAGRAAEMNLLKKRNVYICFGNQKHYVHIKISDDVLYQNILISKELMDEMHLPEYPVYEIAVNENEIIIGPFIGLLMSDDDKNLTASFLNKMMVYIGKYSELHGAVVVFALNKADTSKLLIEGYCYNPIENCFNKGIFPYPSAIYRTVGLSDIWKNHFLSAIGNKLFNSQYFSKWDMHQWFSADTEINSHIPYTVLYKTNKDVYDMLERFGKIYIKPVLGLRGRRIYRISKEKGLYTFKHRENGSNFTETFDNLNEADAYILKSLNKGKYLIQQAIKLLEYDGRLIDFRCIMQKNQKSSWVCNVVIGRYGERDSIVSNISSGGKALRAIDMLKGVLHLSEYKSTFLIKEIETFAFKICEKLDEFGINCGTLGL